MADRDVHIVANGDLTLVQRDTTGYQIRFQVDLRQLCGESRYFEGMLRRGHWRETGNAEINVGEGDPQGLELMLRAIHDTLDSDEAYRVDISAFWHLVLACDYYDIDFCRVENRPGQRLRSWYLAWFRTFCQSLGGCLSLDTCRTLLWPSFVFEAARPFQYLSNELIYGGVHYIMDELPEGVNTYKLHLPGRVIHALNSAKGRLRTVLHRELFDPIESLFDVGCPCRYQTVYEYQKELYRIGVWPLEKTATWASINTLLGRLRRFDYTPRHAISSDQPCENCNKNFNAKVRYAKRVVSRYMHGLCLDCMERTRGRSRDEDAEYWDHQLGLHYFQFDNDCRVNHGKNTAYHSHMGRAEKVNVV